MAVPSQSPENVALEETGRKRTASQANGSEPPEGSPDKKKAAVEADPLDDLSDLGEYPHNTKRNSEPTENPQQFLSDFDMEFGHYDENLFVSHQEAEELLATLESLQGRLATETQPLPLEYDPMPMLAYDYPPMLGWSQDGDNADLKTEAETQASSSSVDNAESGLDRSFRSP